MWFFATWFVSSRALLVAALSLLTGGQETSGDIGWHAHLISDPFAMLQGRRISPTLDSYPAFLSLLEGALAWPLRASVPDFYAWRLTYLFYEGLMGAFLVLTLARLVRDSAVRRRVILAFLACPVGWMTSVIKPQDEVIPGFILALTVWLIAGKRYRLALVTCGIGAVAGKIFLVVPLVALVLLLPVGRLWLRAMFGFGPVAAVYLCICGQAILRGDDLPLVRFASRITSGTSTWLLLDPECQLPALLVRNVSIILSWCAALIPVAVLYRSRRQPPSDIQVAGLTGVTLLGFLLFFFVVCPEYYTIAFVPLLLLFTSARGLVVLSAGMTVPWITNLAVAVVALRPWHAQGSGDFDSYGNPLGGKTILLSAYEKIVPVSTETAAQLALWMNVLTIAGLATLATLSLVRQAQPAAGDSAKGTAVAGPNPAAPEPSAAGLT
jgi:hypothetical protein